MKPELLKNMLSNQFDLNTGISGAQWVFGTTNKGKDINWSRSIYMETAELIDSYPYKHWKSIDQQPDYLNIKIEFVDIWHFIMSLTIEYAFDQYVTNVQKQNPLANIKKETISDKQILDMWNQVILDTCVTFILDIVAESEKKSGLALKAISDKMAAAEKELDRTLIPYEELLVQSTVLSSLRGDDRTNFVISIISTFFIIYDNFIEIDLESIYNGKLTLNKFRQDHGYKEGTYVKKWPSKNKSVEDNVVMFELVDSGITDSEDLYAALEKAYPAPKEKEEK